MIARLKGILEEKSKEKVVIDVQGVGYGLTVPDTVLARLPGEGENVVLQVYTHVREDQLALYGFLTHLERDVFEILLSASGVGPKLASAILSGIEARQLLEAVSQNNKAMLTGIPGVGKKTVEKILVEIREKCEKRLLEERGGVADLHAVAGMKKSAASPASVSVGGGFSWMGDLEQALLALGYKESDVRAVLRETLKRGSEFQEFEAALKFALQLFSANSKNRSMRGTA